MKLKYFLIGFLGLLAILILIIFNPEKDKKHFIEKYTYPESKWFDVDGSQVHYRIVGKGTKDIVFLHGAGACMQHFDSIVPYLSQKYRLILVDNFGHGLSDPPKGKDYGDDTLLKLQEKLVEEVGLTQFSYVVSSFGNYIANLFIRKHKEKVERIIVLGGYGGTCSSANKNDAKFNPEDIPFADELGKYFLPKGIIKNALKTLFYDSDAVSEEIFQMTLDMHSIKDHRLTRKNLNLSTRDHKVINDYGVPNYLIFGEQDKVHNICEANDIRSRFETKPVLKIIPKCGHLPMLEKPRETEQLIDRFM